MFYNIYVKDINNLLQYLVNSKKYKYIMICNCCNQTNDNQEINNGEWRPLTVSKKPLNNYNATIIYKYFTKEVSLIVFFCFFFYASFFYSCFKVGILILIR